MSVSKRICYTQGNQNLFSMTKYKDTRVLGADMVKVEIYIAALNVDDLQINANNLNTEEEEYKYGHESIGRVLDIGENVINISIDDWVIIIAEGVFSSHVMVSQDKIIKKPTNMSIIDASTLMLDYMKAHSLLINYIHHKKPLNILITQPLNSTAMAIIQSALYFEFKIFVTFQSEDEKILLKNLLGNEYFLIENNEFTYSEFKSRTTGGPCLMVDDFQFFNFDMLSNAKILHEVIKFSSFGIYQPLPYSIFDLKNINEAFSFLQKKNYLGKVLVQFKELPSLSNYLFYSEDRDPTYGLSTAEGIDVFAEILKNPQSEVIVSKSGRLENERSKIIEDFYEKRAVILSNTESNKQPINSIKDNNKYFLDKIKTIWLEVLDIDDIPIHGDFFYYGGDSLLAIQVCYKIKINLGINISPNLLIECSNLQAFVRSIKMPTN